MKTTLTFILCFVSVSFSDEKTRPQVGDISWYGPECWLSDRYGDDSWAAISTLPAINFKSPRLEIDDDTSWPILGYPLKSSVVIGINDTLQFQVIFVNESINSFSLKDIKPETWFGPRVFRVWDDIVKGGPRTDSTALQYRLRCWMYQGSVVAQPKEIPALSGGQTMVIDVWGFPPGRYVLTLAPNKNVPKFFQAEYGAVEYEYNSPKNGRDSVNAWEACFWRARDTHDNQSAKNWLDSVHTHYPTSVPGWWLQAIYFRDVGDSASTVAAYDSALHYFHTQADPLMPDTAKAVNPCEIQYWNYCRQMLDAERHDYIYKPKSRW